MLSDSILHLRRMRAEVGPDVFAAVMEALGHEIGVSLERLERDVVQCCADRGGSAHRLAGTLNLFGFPWAAAAVVELADPAASATVLSRKLPRTHARVRAAIRLTRRIRAEEPKQAGHAQNEPKVTL